MPIINDRQPDYENWPSDPDTDMYDRKRYLLDQIESRHKAGVGTNWDFRYLYEKAENFWQLLYFHARYVIELKAEIFARDLEIEDLKRQLKDTLGN